MGNAEKELLEQMQKIGPKHFNLLLQDIVSMSLEDPDAFRLLISTVNCMALEAIHLYSGGMGVSIEETKEIFIQAIREINPVRKREVH